MKTPLLTQEQECAAFELIKAGDGVAREQFIYCNQGLVISIADRHKGKGVAFADLKTAGYSGLLKAIEKFDHKLINPDTQQHYKFSTYATYWIEGAIRRAIRKHTIEARRDRGQYTEQELADFAHEDAQREAAQQAQEVGDDLEAQLEAINSEQDKDCEKLTSKEAVADGQTGYTGSALESRVGSDDPLPADYTEVRDSYLVELEDSTLYRMEVEAVLPQIPDEIRRGILEWRLGLNGKPHLKFSEIGKLLGFSAQRASQLYQDAQDKLKVLLQEGEKTCQPHSNQNLRK